MCEVCGICVVWIVCSVCRVCGVCSVVCMWGGGAGREEEGCAAKKKGNVFDGAHHCEDTLGRHHAVGFGKALLGSL